MPCSDEDPNMTRAQDKRIPLAEACVIRPMLEKWCASQPEKVFVKISRTEEVTYREMRDLAASAAAGLSRLGVSQGDNVVVWMPNTIDCTVTAVPQSPGILFILR